MSSYTPSIGVVHVPPSSSTSHMPPPAPLTAAHTAPHTADSQPASPAQHTQARIVSFSELPIVKRVVSVCLWESPHVSGLTLLSLSLLLFLLHRGYTVLTLVSYLTALQLITCFVFINASRAVLKLRGQATQADDKRRAAGGAAASATAGSAGTAGSASSSVAGAASDEYVSESSLRSLVPLVHSTLHVLLESGMRLIRCSSNVATLRAIGVLCALSVVGRLADGVTCALVACVAALTLPKAYQLNRAAVDAAAQRARGTLDQLAVMVGLPSNKDNKKMA